MAFRIYSGKKIIIYNVSGSGALILKKPLIGLRNSAVILNNTYKATPSGTGF